MRWNCYKEYYKGVEKDSSTLWTESTLDDIFTDLPPFKRNNIFYILQNEYQRLKIYGENFEMLIKILHDIIPRSIIVD